MLGGITSSTASGPPSPTRGRLKCGLIWARLSPAGARLYAPRRGAGLQVTSSTAERSPFPSRGRTIARSKVGETCNIGRRGNASLAGILKSRLNYVIRSLVSGLLLIRCSIFEIPPQPCYPVSGFRSLLPAFPFSRLSVSFPSKITSVISESRKPKTGVK